MGVKKKLEVGWLNSSQRESGEQNLSQPEQPEPKKQGEESRPRPERMEAVKKALEQSLFAESILLTISGQIASIPEMKGRPGLASVSGGEAQTGSLRLTAQGCLERMNGQDWHETVLAQLVHSMYEARRRDRLKRGYLMELKRNAPEDARPAVENWIQWVDYAELTLQEAMVHARELIGSRQWDHFAPQK